MSADHRQLDVRRVVSKNLRAAGGG